MGVFEFPVFAQGNAAIAENAGQLDGAIIIGGGDVRPRVRPAWTRPCRM